MVWWFGGAVSHLPSTIARHPFKLKSKSTDGCLNKRRLWCFVFTNTYKTTNFLVLCLFCACSVFVWLHREKKKTQLDADRRLPEPHSRPTPPPASGTAGTAPESWPPHGRPPGSRKRELRLDPPQEKNIAGQNSVRGDRPPPPPKSEVLQI